MRKKKSKFFYLRKNKLKKINSETWILKCETKKNAFKREIKQKC